MEKIKSITKSRSGFAITANIVTLLVSVILYRPFWEECDDVGMALLAEGAYGYNEPHLVYSNIINGKILCILQSIFAGIRWHAILMYLFVFIASSAFTYILSKDVKGRILSVTGLAATFYELYVSVQYSKVSVAVAIMSYMVLFGIIRQEIKGRERTILAIVSVIALSYSHILRLESFLLATMIAGIYGICLVVYECIKGEFAAKIRTYIKLFAPVFVILALCCAIDHVAYSQGGWNDFLSYNGSRVRMTDYHFNALLYDRHGKELSDLGVSENDAGMYITYQFATGALDPALMDKISALDKKGLSYINVDLMKAWVANIFNDMFVLNALVIALAALIGIFVFASINDERKRYLLATFGVITVVSFGVLFYYQYSCRWNHRIVFALLIAVFTVLVYALSYMEVPEKMKGWSAVFAMIFVCMAGSRLANEFSYQEYMRSAPHYEELEGYMADNKDKVFVADTFTMIDLDKYKVFTTGRAARHENMLYTGSALTTHSPVEKRILERYGYKDPMDALAARSGNVILIDNNSPWAKVQYCDEHGNGLYGLEEVATVGGIDLYMIK